jgi:hypothetical protein
MVPESQANAYFDTSHAMPPDACLHSPRKIYPQIVALSGLAGKYAALLGRRPRRHIIMAMFYYQFVYNMLGYMRHGGRE